MNKHEWKSRAKELERENEQLRAGRCPNDGGTWGEHYDTGYAAGLEDCLQDSIAAADYLYLANPERVNNGCSIYRSPEASEAERPDRPQLHPDRYRGRATRELGADE